MSEVFQDQNAAAEMTVYICLLRAVNVGGHNPVKMETLRALCESLQCKDVATYVQSGNVVFRSPERNAVRLAMRIEDAIEGEFGHRPAVVLRTDAELRDVVARNPFASRKDVEPNKLLVTFFPAEPPAEARDRLLAI